MFYTLLSVCFRCQNIDSATQMQTQMQTYRKVNANVNGSDVNTKNVNAMNLRYTDAVEVFVQVASSMLKMGDRLHFASNPSVSACICVSSVHT